MTAHTLVDRFPLEVTQLQQELSDLLFRDLDNTLSVDEQNKLHEFHSQFLWDVEFHVECSYQPNCYSTEGTYVTNSLGEFLDFQIGQTAPELLVDDLEECSLEDFDCGEVVVEGKTIFVHNLRLKNNG
jgi:hypothetical protein